MKLLALFASAATLVGCGVTTPITAQEAQAPDLVREVDQPVAVIEPLLVKAFATFDLSPVEGHPDVYENRSNVGVNERLVAKVAPTSSGGSRVEMRIRTDFIDGPARRVSRIWSTVELALWSRQAGAAGPGR